MAGIAIELEIKASVDAVWEKLSDFAGIAEWMPGVKSCETEGEGIGAVRTIGMGAITVKERLESRDDAAKSFSYSITEGPLPVSNYLATITVKEAEGGGAHVDWIADFDLPDGVAEDAIAPALTGAYGGALAALKQLLE